MCVPGCQEAVRSALSRRGFFRGAAAAGFAATAVLPAQAQRAPSRSFTRTVDLTHVMSPEFPTFFGVPGHRDGEEVRSQEGRLQSLLVAHHRACRHPSRRADPFLRGGQHRRPDSRRHAGGAAGGRRRGRQGGQEPGLHAHPRRPRRLGKEAPPAARQLLCGDAFRLGPLRRRRERSSPARTRPAYFTSPASAPRPRNG